MKTRKNQHSLPIYSRKKKKKQSKTGSRVGEDDLISTLPDDILVRILSLLTTQESLRCGALSRRWAPLPMLVPMKLEFVKKSMGFTEWRKIEMPKFIHRVNQAVDSYQGEILDEFRICFNLDKRNECQIDKWIQFAMANKVKRLELDLSASYACNPTRFYHFPSIFCDKRLRSRHIGLPSCSSLTALRLHSVNVSGEHIERLLACCPLLESLCVINSNTLTSLKVDGPARLKLLEIKCHGVKFFEISAPNLTSLKYSTCVKTSMHLRTQQLSHMSVGNGFYNFLLNNIHLLKRYLNQIETLSLLVCCYRVILQELRWPSEIPTLSNLKKLKIIVTPDSDTSVICITSCIETSPLLRKFVVKRKGNCSLATCLKPREAILPGTGLHQHLKEFKFVGFNGDEPDIRLVLYIIENAANLDKIVIDCRDPSYSGTHLVEKEIPRISVAKDCATMFQSRVSPTVEFVLIP